MKSKSSTFLLFVLFLCLITSAQNSTSPNVFEKFTESENFGERVLNLRLDPEIRVHINSPSKEMFVDCHVSFSATGNLIVQILREI